MFFIFTPTPGEMGWLKPPPNSDTLILTTSKLRTEVPCFFLNFPLCLTGVIFRSDCFPSTFFPSVFLCSDTGPVEDRQPILGKNSGRPRHAWNHQICEVAWMKLWEVGLELGSLLWKPFIFEGSNMNILPYLLWGSEKWEVTCTYLYFLSIFLNILLVVALCFQNAERNLFLSSNHHFSQGGMWILRGM